MSDTTQIWRVVSADGTVHEVEVYRELGGWFTDATGCHGLATPREAVMEHAVEQRWPVAEILAPGQSTRAEIAQENEVLRLDTERAWNALRHTARACTLPEADGTPARLPVAVGEILADLHTTLDRLRAVVEALPRCETCGQPATQENADDTDALRCDDHVPPAWEANDLPYAAEVRAWRGAR